MPRLPFLSFPPLPKPCALNPLAHPSRWQNSECKNQDDFVAINKGSNISILSNVASGGHGLSIGSIKTGKVVSFVLFPSPLPSLESFL